ncbi:MAG: M28 family peptidase [Planctomycetes bacterium]|nr:M28 family peptidase [Planctomycetota bacterium]
MLRISRSLLSALGVATVAVPALAFPDPAADSITAGELKAHVDFLASDELAGREAGTPGGQAAADYIAAEFAAYGLRPCGDGGGWFQAFRASGADCRNVVGCIPGSDSVLAAEVVVMGAHYDHVGLGHSFQALDRLTGGRGKVHNGADDNASGTSGILELAEAFATTGPRRRTLVFIAFDGEEKGLLGSSHYVEHPAFPLANTVLMINLDMIGRGDGGEVACYGTNTSPGFRDLVERHREAEGLLLSYPDWMLPNSDHASFLRHDVPVLFLFTGLHADYHRATDDPEKVDAAAMQAIVRLLCGVAGDTADAETRPPFTPPPGGDFLALDFRRILGEDGRLDPLKLREALERVLGKDSGLEGLFGEDGEELRRVFGGEGGPFGSGPLGGRARLGVSVDAAEGVHVQGVHPGSPAEHAGVRPGDRIVSIDGRPVASFGELRDAVSALEDGRAVDLGIERDGEAVTLRAVLGAEKDPGEADPARGRRWY